jgi:hypothetical protein
MGGVLHAARAMATSHGIDLTNSARGKNKQRHALKAVNA